ncbi:MAG: MmcQ/YjbR family DNA-binding protein [Hyphomicrobiales bacterium]|nr:MmcQ/YjbR family DNA-binding protein [Hyphomicrobiales bacterium]
MTKEDLRRLALALPGAEEKFHFDKADFRVRNKIFASLKDDATGVIKLLPEQQTMVAEAEPRVFQPLAGGWGRKGWTKVILAKADEITLKSALQTAWRNVAPKLPQI